MITPDQAFRALQEANPSPTVAVEDRPPGEEMLARVKQDEHSGLWVHKTPVSPRRRGPLVAAAVFIVVLVLGILAGLIISDQPDVVDTTVPTPTTLETSPPDLTPELAEMVRAIEDAYNSGDFEAVQALMAPGADYVWQRASEGALGGIPWTAADLQTRFEIDVALNTQITLDDCQSLSEGGVLCVALRVDDLTRARRLEASRDVRWQLGFAEGLITEWVETTPDVSNYYELARRPFQEWFTDTYPSLESPATLLVGQPWRTDAGFEEIAAEVVAEYAAAVAEVPEVGAPPGDELFPLLTDFAETYSRGDLNEMKAMLSSDAAFTFRGISKEEVVWTDGELETRYRIDAALNTTLTFNDCYVIGSNRVTCRVFRIDDLVRVLDLEPARNPNTPLFRDVRWTLEFEDRRVTDWVELAPDESQYHRAARDPFLDWLAEAHPALATPVADVAGRPWRADPGFALIVADLIAEWAGSLEVTLDD